MKPGDVLECRTCGARSLPLHTTGGRRFEEGGGLICTWPDRELAQGRHEAVTDAWFSRGQLCLGCHYDRIDGRAPAAAISGAEFPAPAPYGTPNAVYENHHSYPASDLAEPSPLDRYEELAAAFLRETGMLAPGKDVPTRMHGPSIEERSLRWREWCAERARAAKPKPTPKPTPPRGQLGLF